MVAGNANAAFDVRRSDNLSWNNWDQQTPSGKLQAWSCCNSVVAMQVIPPDQTSIAGTHVIVNQQNGEAIDNDSSPGATGNQGVGVILYSKNSNAQQKWTFTQNSDATWSIICQFNGQALDCSSSSAGGAQVVQFPADSGNNNQHWSVDLQSDGTYKIWSKGNSKSLDSGSKTGNKIPLVQWNWNGGSQQRWILQ